MPAPPPLPYLSHQLGLAGPGELVLADVPVQPVADVQVTVVPRDDQVNREGCGTRARRSEQVAAGDAP